MDCFRFAQFEKQFDRLCHIIDNNEQNSDPSLKWSTLLATDKNECDKCNLHHTNMSNMSMKIDSIRSKDSTYNQWYHKKYYANMVRDYAIPIKMIIRHKPTNRTLTIYRQHPFDIIPIISKTKFDLTLNWLFLPYCQLKKLYNSDTTLLCNKIGKAKRMIVSTQEIPTHICRKLGICQSKTLQIDAINQTVKMYSRCKHKSNIQCTLSSSACN